jgi:hypothetical protein
MSDETATKPADGQRPADSIPVEATPTPKPIETAATLNAAQEAAVTPPADPAPPTAEDPAPETPKVKKLDEWAEKRISEEAFHRREEARRRKEAEAEAERLRKEVEALRAPQQNQATPPAMAQPAPLAVNPADFDRAVAAEAARRAAEAQFNADCNRIHDEGKALYKDEFEAALKNLGALGALNEQVLQTIIATGEGPRLLMELGSDPAEAEKVLRQPPAILAIELGKRAALKPSKAAAPVSNAPAPIKPLEGSARVSAEPRDEDDDATYFAKRREQLRARRGW